MKQHKHASPAANTAALFLTFVDSIGKSIANLKVSILSDGQKKTSVTGQDGTLPLIQFDKPTAKGEIFAIIPTGQEEKVCSFDIMGGLTQQVLRSPYVLVPGTPEPHEGTPTSPSAIRSSTLGSARNKRSARGHPEREVIIGDCPNDDNLHLAPNHQYKEAILAASKRTHIMPQAIAAIINAECGKKKDKVTWDPNSTAAAGGSATGMTQFVKGTWKGEAMRDGTYINKLALERGHIVVVEQTKIVKRANKKRPAVVKKVTSTVIKHETALLAMRTEPVCAINACVDYAVENLRKIAKAGFDLSSLNDGEKAKIIYLAHHLGCGDAIKFLKNEIKADDETITLKNGRERVIKGAESLLRAQFPKNEAGNARHQIYVDRGRGNLVIAHRYWLVEFIERNITVGDFSCERKKLPTIQSFRTLVVTIGGQHPEGYL